jgi:uncharacterized protein YndB with AHSA1/START domain
MPHRALLYRVAILACCGLLAAAPSGAAPRSLELAGFAFEVETTVVGTPAEAFQAFTAETLQWWDHHFSTSPKQLFFETRPGGGFMEIFDEAGNGARHATVIYCERPKTLRFVGPLGLSGKAMEMVHTVEFTPAEGGGTRVHLEVRGFGEESPGLPEMVENVWHHFLVERFQPYMAARVKK